MFTRKIALLMIVFILAMSFASAPAAQAGTPSSHGAPHEEFRSSDGASVGIKVADSDRAILRQALLTREGRMSAQPIPFQGGSGASAPSLSRPTGAPGFAPGGAPREDAKSIAQSRYPEAWQSRGSSSARADLAKDLTAFGTAGRYSSYPTNYFDTMWTDNPWEEVGKLYILDGTNVYACTASLIAENVIVTAAHCVFNTDYNYWYDAWTFVPAERDYAGPYGEWDGYDVWFPTSWAGAPYSSAGMRYDMAVITLPFVDGGGLTVSDYVGWLGRAWNLDSKQELHAIGYPIYTNYPVDGDAYTYTCAAESFQKGVDVLGLGCDLLGSDGSPWIYKFTPYLDILYADFGYNVGNYVNAVTSGGISGKTWGTTLYGPKFRSTNIEVLCDLVGC
jgi:V8-like Glu-specific endopeptidase